MATAAEQVRLLIADTSVPYHFTDGQIDIFLSMAGSVVYLAAALALESWAAEDTGEVSTEKIGDYSYSKLSASGRLSLAKHYREMYATEPCSDWAEWDFLTYGEGE